jgi:hypothetical protein
LNGLEVSHFHANRLCLACLRLVKKYQLIIR